MFRLYTCLVTEHDHALVLLAGLICAGTVISSFRTYAQVLSSDQRQAGWLVFTGASMAAGVWATHFVAMLAYTPAVPIGFRLDVTALSYLVAAVMTTAGFAISANTKGYATAAGGAVIGAGVGAMHFTGMAALQVPGVLEWNVAGIGFALAVGIVLAAGALWTYHAKPGRRGFWSASALLAAAICGLHFTAMAAVTIVPDPTIAGPASIIDRALIAVGIAGLSVFGLAAGLAASTVERLRLRLSDQLVRLEAEIEERRRAESLLTERQSWLISHQAVMADLMRDDSVRSGSLRLAMRKLTKALALELGIERAGILLLDRTKTRLSFKELYTREDDRWGVPDGYGSSAHLAMLMGTSAHEIVAVEDTSDEHPLTDFTNLFFEKAGIVSVLHAPVVANGELVGFMTCTNVSRKISWAPEHRVLALGIANLAAVVVERHQRLELEDATQSSAMRLSRQQGILTGLIGSDALRSGDIDQLFDQISSVLCKEMGVDRVSIRFFPEAGIDWSYTGVLDGEGQLQETTPSHLKAPYPAVLAKAIMTGPIVVEDCANDPLTAGIYETNLEPRRIRAMLHTPILNDEALIGNVACSMYDTTRAWRPEDVLLASGVANVVALAVERRMRLKMEVSLRQANLAAEEASRAKSLFLANMSHEIRTPMNGVLGMADLLSRSGLSERQKRLAGTITESARSLLTIINDILDISRIEGGKFQLEPSEFDLSQCIEDAVELLAEQAYTKALDLNVFIDHAAVGIVNADPVRLRQVLVNLIGNAIKFTEHGEVSVHVAPDADEARDALRFTVRDTGIGIDRDVQAKLFTPFTQADTSITRRFGGTGLGLSISRHLVEMMGGHMGLDSTPGEGSSIWFVLPLSVRHDADAAFGGAFGGAEGLTGRRVLVVDDRATNREIISSYLAASGAVIEAKSDAAAAMATLHHAATAGQPFDLAIIDLIMEGDDGLELARTIRAAPTLSELKLILLSSLAWINEGGDAREAGFDMLLHKPIRRNDLVSGAMACLARSGAPARALPAAEPAMEPQPLRLNVLVAEDNPVNQVVAEEYLTNIGCTVTIAENGVQALAAMKQGQFDAVLMDCQMPEMDGYTATHEIRSLEKAAGQGRETPIIAVTANAYEADRQRCLAAGMNGYLSKPYSESQLVAALRLYTADKRHAGAGPRPPETGACECKAAITPVRPDLRARLMRTYLDYAPGSLPTLKNALDDRDGTAVALVAHSLKSGSANVGETGIADLCAEIERAARAGEIERCGPLIGEVETLIGALQAATAADETTRRAIKAG